ncbi:MAG: LysM peptidoglycan-binding domain-containing protein [Chloroflexota bacterium]|nr:LysM peptidoglycan-binding domain-containing protein [Chloroflexota bacterium]
MRLQKLIIRACLAMAIAVLFGLAAEARMEDPGSALMTERLAVGLERYTVRPNDALYTIAKRFNTSVKALQSLNDLRDPRLLFADDVLLVPRLDKTEVAAYQIKPGDSLFEIALRFDTTVEDLLSLNGIGDRDHIVSGQTILLPQSAGSAIRREFAHGITLFPDLESTPEILRRVKELGVNWAKIEVSWADLEPAANSFAFDDLDALIAGLDQLGIHILLNVYAAPQWSRRSYTRQLNSLLRANSGPPENLEVFGSFMSVLAARYAGIVDAYEIWKSPNLLKYWTAPVYELPPTMGASGDYGFPDKIKIGAAYYVDLLKVAFEAIKSVDSGALVITAGLAPVGFTDNYNAVETGAFLGDMIREGATNYSDGIGALFGASAVPPTLFCCEQPPGVDTHYESHLQYFREILYLYRDILSRNASDDIPIYITQAGWGTTEGSNLAIPASGLEWLKYTDQDEQALYAAQAYDIAYGLDYIEGNFLYNLNGCAVGDSEACFFSLVDAAGADRPAFQTFAEIEKTAPKQG